ncbi:MAG TPA: VOC family protein [Acidimicrobiales bacterium]|nr:VOC family protein [Acidimicrobiales bacterium]
MPAISSLGHVGLYCSDLSAQIEFYTGLLGLTKTDEDLENGLVFLSAQPEEEHHELLLVAGRNAGREARVVQQISFRCGSLEDVTGYYRRFVEHEVPLDMVVSHGNAVGVYFFDPEGNRCEVYWQTGLSARQPYVQAVDLDDDPAAIVAAIEASVVRYGETGIVDREVLARQDIGRAP